MINCQKSTEERRNQEVTVKSYTGKPAYVIITTYPVKMQILQVAQKEKKKRNYKGRKIIWHVFSGETNKSTHKQLFFSNLFNSLHVGLPIKASTLHFQFSYDLTHN